MPRARLTWYAESIIPYKFIRHISDNEKEELINAVKKELISKELAKSCINKLRELRLIGEWLVELWYFEIFENRKDEATGYNYEKQGMNVWRAEWITTAVPPTVLEMDNEIVHRTRTFRKIKVNNLELRVEAYFTLSGED